MRGPGGPPNLWTGGERVTAVDFLWAIPVFGLLVFIHELGHFSVAKYFDIRVHEFAIGFGPMLAGFDRGETRYNLRLIPLGGFVRMAGMEDGDQEEPRGFAKKSVGARAAVIAAGPIMNFVLAALLYSAFLFLVGQEQVQVPRIGDVPATCQAVVAGQSVARPCPAYAAGLRPGDLVKSINGAPVGNWQDILDTVKASDGKPQTFVVQRDSETREFHLQPVRSPDNRWLVGIAVEIRREPLGRALVQGPVLTAKTLGAMVVGLADMVTGRVKPQLAGPVGITRTIAEQAARGWDNLLLLTAFLSINLGLFNLLPIPALDGSRLVFMGVELVRGRQIDPQRENMVHFVGFLILVGLMLFITYGEVIRH
jgi:regulator of sigma E protease